MSKVVLVIGATGGLGAACAKDLAQHGWQVIVAGRNRRKGEEVIQEIKKQGQEATFSAFDIKDDASIKKVHQDVISKFGRLDAAINAAGILHEQVRFADISPDTIRDVLHTNLTGVMISMQEQIHAMQANPGGSSGHIINFTSIYGLTGVKTGSVYSATKHALVGLTKSTAIEYGNQNIRVNGIAPGLIMSEMTAHLDPSKLPDGEMKTDLERMMSRYVQGRIGQPEDVAKGVRYLLESDWVTGSVLQIDGGYTAG